MDQGLSQVMLDVLSKGLFIIYDTLYQDENAQLDEGVLYLYCKDKVELEAQHFFIGSVDACVGFFADFTKQPVNIIRLSRSKIAVKKLLDGQLTLLLTGSIKEQDDSIINHLDTLYKAFLFYNGPFEYIVEKSKGSANRKDVLAFWAGLCQTLIPLFQKGNRSRKLELNDFSKAFDFIPYIELAPRAF
eukprot:TRINITY_DN5496_c0_g1_i1.p1 TRINITY_DN5496_c0_g1~~TRINITY_DN5496_c0_g1_i1.p1  ORF type:complete len:188 (-),score=29.96 TRINITY_DN5496_c0_g1_i1:85-648(-)